MARKKTPEINASSTADIAFLLLTFFLMTTTMDVDSGLFRRLPPMPPPDQVIAPPVAKRNILQVLVNKNDLLAVNGELMQIENLKEKAKEFILNPQTEKIYRVKLLRKFLSSDKLKFQEELSLFKVTEELHTKCILPFKMN